MHPLLVRHLLYPLHERLKGRRTFAWLRRLEQTQWLPPDELRTLQLERLRAHLRFAYERVPYYHHLLDTHGLSAARIQTLDDFARIPALTRDVVRTEFERLQARPQLPRTQRIATGGSTGAPVAVLIDMERMAFGEAARFRSHRWFGLEPGAREIVLWAAPAELTRQDLARQLRDRLIGSRLLSAFDMSEAALARYARIIQRHRPEKMYGYASAFHLLSRYLETTRWQPPRGLRAIFTTAEPLFDFQRKTIQSVFDCAVATEYGSRDGGMAANECPEGGLHIPVEGMHVEVLDADQEGLGEIVVTILDSFAFPIIRYRTGDVGRLEAAPCACGRSLPRLKSVEGRQTDFIVTPEGGCLHALAIIYPLREIAAVREFQVVQDVVDHMTVTVVPAPGFSADDERQIRDQLRLRLGSGVSVDMVRAPAIARGPAGKFRYVVSHVAASRLDRTLGRPAG